MPPFELNVWNK